MAGVRKLPYFNRKSAWVSRPQKRKSVNNYSTYRVSIYTKKFPNNKLVAHAWFKTKEKANEWIDAFENGEDLPNTVIAKKENAE
jgi:3-polyprenyl-4-hydroxybenzoate decarboxylase